MQKPEPTQPTTLDFHPDPALFRDLPDSPGVYRFHGANDEILYIGKSTRIRQRVKSHFSARHRDYRENRMAWLTRRISFTGTAAELGALLLENHEIKQELPIFNRRQRRARDLFSWHLQQNEAGFLLPVPGSVKGGRHNWRQDSFGVFRSQVQARQTLEKLTRENTLCPKVLGLETGDGACFAFQLKRCHGACTGMEPAEKHNQRLRQALQQLHIAAWPWAGAIIIRDRATAGEEYDFHVIREWRYLGSASSKEQARALIKKPLQQQFDLDTYRILMRYRNLAIWPQPPDGSNYPDKPDMLEP